MAISLCKSISLWRGALPEAQSQWSLGCGFYALCSGYFELLLYNGTILNAARCERWGQTRCVAMRSSRSSPPARVMRVSSVSSARVWQQRAASCGDQQNWLNKSRTHWEFTHCCLHTSVTPSVHALWQKCCIYLSCIKVHAYTVFYVLLCLWCCQDVYIASSCTLVQ